MSHVNNLPRIIAAGRLWSEAKRLKREVKCEIVGMSEIKRRRLEELNVTCHNGTKVGEYVPFYFCPRSVMLYILHCGNHPELTYRGGQGPIMHCEADLKAVIEWADKKGRRWAFSDRNAGARYASFYNDLDSLDKIDWTAVAANDFRSAQVKEGKQAEFLGFGSFPWELVERIAVLNTRIKRQAEQAIKESNHCPPVLVETNWYF